MTIREALLTDIPQLQVIRLAVKENRLSDPALVPASAYETYLELRGKGWVAEEEGSILGFAIVDLEDANVWALFVHPEAEGKGMGKALHDTLVSWYFAQTDQPLWLSTAPGTRAETFYRRAGWTETGLYGKGEIKFERQDAG